MTAIFDFVRYVTYFAEKEGFEDIVIAVLKKTITENKSKNFTNWVVARGKTVPLDIDSLDTFFDDFHDLDHHYHHKVFCDRSYRILYQFSKLFRDYPFKREDNLFLGRDIRTLKKYVPSIMDYVNKYYNNSHGMYQLKK